VVDYRLHRWSAASRDRIRGIVGTENVATPPRQKELLHEAARFDTARLVVTAFRRRSSAMTKQAGSDPNVRQVINKTPLSPTERTASLGSRTI
jgi:hypothetical protein